MKDYVLIDGISELDNDLLEEHLVQKEKLQLRQKKHKRAMIYKWTAAAACLALVLSISIPLAIDRGGKSFGDMGNYQVSLSEVVTKGNGITEADATAFLQAHEEEILKLVSQGEDIAVEDLRLSYYGVYHVTLTTEENFINEDMLTYYVLTGDGKIVSTVELYRSAGELIYQLSGSGIVTETINAVLAQHPDADFAMIYIDAFTEAMVAPDNTVYFLNGEKPVPEELEYYSMFNLEKNIIGLGLLG